MGDEPLLTGTKSGVASALLRRQIGAPRESQPGRAVALERFRDHYRYRKSAPGGAARLQGAAQARMKDMNSARVSWLVSKDPRMALETVVLRCFWTPRIIMQV